MDAHKRELARKARAAARAAERASFPLSVPALQQIFAMLGDKLAAEGCDHSLRWTTEWLTSRELDPVPVVAWLRDNGGFCDCEVLCNVEERVAGAAED